MIYILSFIAYVLIVSLLGWLVNRPKPLTWELSAKAVSVKTVSLFDWAEENRIIHDPMILFPDEESAKRFYSFRECEFRGEKFLIKNESSGNLKDSDFYESDLGIPWKPKGNHEND